jgi:hypothetical protein
MVIENPRDGSRIEFLPDPTASRDVDVINDLFEAGAVFDEIAAYQPVLWPDGFTGLLPTVIVNMMSQDAILDTSLPQSLELEDWPNATITFGDLIPLLLGPFPGVPLPSQVTALIETLTPVAVSALPGDFNGSGVVEQADLDLVLLNWGTDASSAPAIWTNDLPSGVVDQDELDRVLLGWGNTTMSTARTPGAVPEPQAWIMAVCGLTGILVTRSIPPRLN